MTGFNIGNTMQDLTFYKLQQQTQQLIQQQNAYLAAQLQLARSQSVSTRNNHLTNQPKPLAQRSLSDVPSYPTNTSIDGNMRLPPGLAAAPQSFPLTQNSQTCGSLQRRDSAKSDSSISSAAESASRYKTEKCRSFEETGRCRYGSKCQYAHGDGELRYLNRHPRYKTELCRTYHTTNICSYGIRCNFIHEEDERRVPQMTQAIRPSALQLNSQQPFSGSVHTDFHTNSKGSSPASSIYGDLSPSHSPNYLVEDPFSPNPCSRLSPAPSLSSFSSDMSSKSFPSPPSTPPHSDDLCLDTQQSFALDLSALLNSLRF